MKTFNGRTFFKIGNIKFRVSRTQPSTTHDYNTSYFQLHKMDEGIGLLVANIGMEKSYHPNRCVAVDYKGTLHLESLEPNKLITEDEALALAKEYAECIL